MSRKDSTLPTVHFGDLCLYYDLFSMLVWAPLHTHTDVHTNCPRTLHADRYLTQYFWHSLTGNVKMPMIGLKMPCPSSQPMSLSLISNENIFSLVSYTMRRFSVSQTRAFCRRFIHCDPTKIGASLHWNASFFAKNSTF